MSFSKPWSTLCLLSLSVPALGFGSPFWFFSSAPDNCCPKAGNSKVNVEREPCEEHNVCPPKCDAPKPCCETRTVTEVVTVCEDPCHPSHCNWEAAVSLGIGYRHDRLNQKLDPSASSGQPTWRSKYNDFNSVMAVLRFDARVYNFLFSFEGDYAPVVDGRLHQDFDAVGTAEDSHYKFNDMTGYGADAQVAVGYRLKFIDGKKGRAYLVPQVGYRYSHQAYETEEHDRFVNPSQAGNRTQFMQDQAPMHSEWFGPFLEARLSFVFWQHFHVDPYYQYHFLDYRSTKKVAVDTFTVDPAAAGAIPSQQVVTRAVIDNDNARGQSAGLDLFWQFGNQFRLGGKGSWTLFETHSARAHVKSTQTTYETNPAIVTESRFKEDAHAKWTNYSFYIYGGYSF